jgi:hypothetical protein
VSIAPEANKSSGDSVPSLSFVVDFLQLVVASVNSKQAESIETIRQFFIHFF